MIFLSAIHDALVIAGFFPEANGRGANNPADTSMAPRNPVATDDVGKTPQDYEIGE